MWSTRSTDAPNCVLGWLQRAGTEAFVRGLQVPGEHHDLGLITGSADTYISVADVANRARNFLVGHHDPSNSSGLGGRPGITAKQRAEVEPTHLKG